MSDPLKSKPVSQEIAEILAWRHAVLKSMPRAAIIVADCIERHARAQEGELLETQLTIPQIVKETGLSLGTVRDALRRLARENLLRKEPVGGGVGEPRQGGNRLRLWLPEGETRARDGPRKKKAGAM